MSSRVARVRLLIIVFFVVAFSLYWYQQQEGDALQWSQGSLASLQEPVVESISEHLAHSRPQPPPEHKIASPPSTPPPPPPPPPPVAFAPLKEAPPKDATSKEDTLKDATWKDATSKDATSKDTTSKDATSKVASPSEEHELEEPLLGEEHVKEIISEKPVSSESLPKQKPIGETTTPKPAVKRPMSSLPDIYRQTVEPPAYCADRFGLPFLHHLNQSAEPFCTEASSSQVTCFHVTTSRAREDSLCIGGPVRFDDSRGLFGLDCALEDDRHLTTLESYWYDTGPGLIFRQFVDSELDERIAPAASNNASTLLLIKREGSANLWHSFMEIFAATLTLDTISIGVDPRSGAPIMQHDERLSRLRVVVLDDHEKGPYWPLWEAMSPLPLTRLDDLTPDMVDGSQIIVPLAGGANPFWQVDWDVLSCSESALLDAFVARVLGWLKLPAPNPEEATEAVRITYVDRREKRKLAEQDRHVEALRASLPGAQIDVVDFAQLDLAEQVAKARDTDVLVGVHGAGLTHAMFMARGAAVVEMMPATLDHKGFRNLAKLRGLQYFGAHGGEVQAGADWHDADVQLDEALFVRLVDAAAASVANQGLRNHDISR